MLTGVHSTGCLKVGFSFVSLSRQRSLYFLKIVIEMSMVTASYGGIYWGAQNQTCLNITSSGQSRGG